MAHGAASEDFRTVIQLIKDMEQALENVRLACAGWQVEVGEPLMVGDHVLIAAGTIGTIVGVRVSGNAPFVIEFPGFSLPFAPSLHHLKIIPGLYASDPLQDRR